MAAGTAPRLKRLLTKAGRPCALREPEMDCEGPNRASPGRQAAARPGEAQSWQASAPSAEGSCGGASARRGHIRHGRIRLAVGRKARGERGHRVLVFPRTATWIGSFSGIKAGPACSGFGHLAHGMDALLYNSPVAGRASPDAHCQRGSPVSADLGDEIVAIWDAVSDYILEQMKLDKGVLVPGLGLFAAVREQFHSKEVAVSVRRPVFQLDIGVLWLQDLQSPTDIIPDDVKIERLNYRQLSRATGISLHVVQRCVRETVLLYCHLLRNKAHVSFAFKNIGVMTYEDDFLCMRFLSSCITTLESNASLTALLHTRIWPARSADFGSETTAHGIQVLPRFQLAVKKSRAEAAAERNAAVARKMSRGGTAGRLLQKRKTLPPSMLLQYQAGSRQQDVAKKPSASVLPPCAGSSHGRKQAGQKEPSTPAQTSTALPATEDSKRVLQELREVSALWNEADRTWPVYQQQVEQTRAERAAWEGWSAGEDQPPLQRFASASVWAPRLPAQPRGQQVRRRWRKDVDPPPGSKMGTATKLALHADLLSPRAAQVLQRLEPHLHQQEAFADTAERNRQKLELKRQLPCARCSYRSRGEGAGNSAGAVGKGAGKLSGFPPVNGKS
ncbi:coiled-coil domain-containing protein 81 isoform X2 [Gallus gallus]|uniref:coiled-coil domain-containing protein 81 isoform X2 n=2 Tax=Gallus gallus TaxID=9031 RepID=UPI001AEAC8B4|nr:coiled-coil domain-containing protein 81 isoform X2 [Gallus gallus]